MQIGNCSHLAREQVIAGSIRPARLLRVPLLAGLIVFCVAVGSTQLALHLASRDTDRQTERLALVYLDGLEALTRADLAARDWAAVERRLQQSFQAQGGVAELALLVRDMAGVEHVRSPAGTGLTPPLALQSQPSGTIKDHASGILWTQRTVALDPAYQLVAALDISDIRQSQRRLGGWIALLDLVLAGLCSLAAFLVLRRLERPVEGLLALLRDSTGAPRPVPPALAQRAGKDLQPVLAAYNQMVEGLSDRDRLRSEITERNHAAALGRLAATLAHEVRNPLGGLATAVTTLRKFGADPDVRQESLAFLARGIDSLEALVSRMLKVYRPQEERRLTRDDMADLRLLVAPAAHRRGVGLEWSLDLPATFDVAASGVRQVLLNLLLNAIAASPAGSTVKLSARMQDGHFVCAVSDAGPGMDHAHIRRLLRQAPAAETATRRLGIDAVVSLLGDLDARASVQAGDHGGTTVRIDIPLKDTA